MALEYIETIKQFEYILISWIRGRNVLMKFYIDYESVQDLYLFVYHQEFTVKIMLIEHHNRNMAEKIPSVTY